MKSDKLYLQHILEMIDRIDAAIAIGREAFIASHLHQDAVLRNLHTMTETTQRLSAGLKDEHPEVEWATLSAFRNVLVHDYLGIDIDLVWTVVTRDIPDFKMKIQEILKDLA
ncbi:MAG: DUF86 domain-containing protein [Candidatus Krumholzibacteriia bacterium]